MALSEIFFLAIALYVLYRFIFNFVVPIARTTRHVRQQFRNMQGQQDPTQGQGPYSGQSGSGYGPQTGQAQNPPRKPSSDTKAGEYIDFEEIR